MADDMMKALRLEVPNGIEATKITDIEKPAPGPGEVRVAMRAAALNHREIWIAHGKYPGMTLPATLGADGAGVIDAVGQGVDPAVIGQAVILYPGLEWGADAAFPSRDYALLGMPGPGTIAQAICVRADRVVPKPDFMSFVEAAAWPLAGLTAWRALFTKARLEQGETVLVTGAGGGVASCAVALAAAAGARVIVTSSSAETIAAACGAGAAAGVNYRDTDWSDQLAAIASDISVVIDGAPTQSYPHYARALQTGARIVVYGASGGPAFEVKVAELFLKNLSVIGTNMGNVSEFAAMVAFVERHGLRPAIDRIFPLEQAAAALSHLASGHHYGKVVIEVAA